MPMSGQKRKSPTAFGESEVAEKHKFDNPGVGRCEGDGTSQENRTSEDNDFYLLQWNKNSDTSEHFFRRELQNLYDEVEMINLTDVTLCSSEGELVPAHKLVLSMCSPFFRRLFLKAAQVNKSNAILVLGNVKLRHLRLLLQYIYVGKVNVPSEELEEFIMVGEMLEIEGFTEGNLPTQTRFSESDKGTFSGSENKGLGSFHDDMYTKWPTRQSYPLAGGLNIPSGRLSLRDDERSILGGRRMDTSDGEESIASSASVFRKGNQRVRPPRVNNNHHNWTQVQMTDEELARNWRSDGGYNHANKMVRYYYCAHAKHLDGQKRPSGVASLSCRAQLKRVIHHGIGKVVYQRNGVPHGDHQNGTGPTIEPPTIDTKQEFHEQRTPTGRKGKNQNNERNTGGGGGSHEIPPPAHNITRPENMSNPQLPFVTGSATSTSTSIGLQPGTTKINPATGRLEFVCGNLPNQQDARVNAASINFPRLPDGQVQTLHPQANLNQLPLPPGAQSAYCVFGL